MADQERNALPSTAYLRECFDYNSITGELHWRIRPREHFTRDQDYHTWKIVYAGKPAGSRNRNRFTVRLNNPRRQYLVHRIIWKMVTDEEPGLCIDHRNPADASNDFSNLRPATKQQNQMNRRVMSNNSLRTKGVCKTRNGKFGSRITINGDEMWLGTHETPEEAHAAYCKKAQELFGEFWNPG